MPILKKCLNCGKEFKTSPSKHSKGHGKYCSRDCKIEHQRGENSPKFSKIETKCSNHNCGKTMFLSPSLMKSARSYCSKDCFYADTEGNHNGGRPSTLVDTICQNPACRKPFKAYPGQIDSGGGKYCSRECSGIMATGKNNNRYSRIDTKCSMCGKPIKIKRCYLGSRNNHFCSKECKDDYQVGEKSSAWCGGISFLPYPPEFNERLKEVIRHRDNYQCCLCGISEKDNDRKLDIHHIDYNKDNCLYENLVSLCHSCHPKTGTNREQWQSHFQNLITKITC